MTCAVGAADTVISSPRGLASGRRVQQGLSSPVLGRLGSGAGVLNAMYLCAWQAVFAGGICSPSQGSATTELLKIFRILRGLFLH